MPFATRHRDDPMQTLAPLHAMSVELVTDARQMADLQNRSLEEMERRLSAGHRAYVAYIARTPVAWGWVAARSADIGEVGAVFSIPAGERYLWNFVTLPSHRGMGIYPRLLQSIVNAEAGDAERFWIAYAPENHASGAGIAKAGFTTLAEMSFDAFGKPAVRELVSGGAAVASRVVGLRETSEPLTPCWRCVRAGRTSMTCDGDTCACNYQVPQSGCAA